MRGETVAEAIKRRMAEKADARRKSVRAAVDIAIWSGVIGFFTMMLGVAVSYLSGSR